MATLLSIEAHAWYIACASMYQACALMKISLMGCLELQAYQDLTRKVVGSCGAHVRASESALSSQLSSLASGDLALACTKENEQECCVRCFVVFSDCYWYGITVTEAAENNAECNVRSCQWRGTISHRLHAALYTKRTKQSGEGEAYHANSLVKATRQQHRRLGRIPGHRLHLVLMVVQCCTAKKRKQEELTTPHLCRARTSQTRRAESTHKALSSPEATNYVIAL